MDENNVPHILTEIPGPKARSLLERQDRYLVYTLPTSVPVVWQRADGAVVTDVDGNRYIDFTSGVSVMNVGHSHPAVTRRLASQAGRLMQSFFAPTDVQVESLEALADVLPPSLRHIIFTNTGAEAVEQAVKIARSYQKKSEIICFHGSFHGRSVLTRALGGMTNTKRGYDPMPPGQLHAPYPYCYRCPFGLEREGCDLQCLHYLERLMNTVSTGDTAAVLVEPYLGVGGSVVPPVAYLEGLRAFCDRHGLLLIFDEVQASFGRTGKMFAFEHGHFLPDIVVLGKGLASGVPTSAVVLRDEIAAAARSVGWPSTFSGNPLSCAAVVASIEVLLEERLPERAARTGAHVMARLEQMQSRWALIGDVRGMGLSIGVEFVKDRRTKEPAREEAGRIYQSITRRGLLTLPPGGQYGNVLRITPPLVISEALADKGLDILEAAVAEASTA